MISPNYTNGCMDFLPSDPTQSPDLDICSAFYISHVIRQLDMQGVHEQLCIIVDDHGCREYEFLLSIKDLFDEQNILTSLAAYGLVIAPWYRKPVCTLLFHEYQRCTRGGYIKYQHSSLGWFESNGERVFLTDATQIGSDMSLCNREGIKFRSGRHQDYYDFLTNVVYPVPTLSLAMAIGYAAPVVSLLQQHRDLGTIIVNFCGASSTGKTTASQLLVSPFACPTISNKGGLIHTFHSTTNAIYSGIRGINGMPMVLDDVTTNPWVDLPNLIYTLATGEQKARCNADGSLRTDADGWSGIVVISSETPIQEARSQNQGLQVRVINTQGITWTPDAKTAEMIKATIQANYGYTGADFAEYVGAYDMDELLSRFDSAQESVRLLMSERDKLSDRLEIKYAAIYLTIELMDECFKLQLDPNQLVSILLTPEQASVPERDIATKALTVVENCIISDTGHFDKIYRIAGCDDGSYDTQATKERYGTIVYRQHDVVDVYILTPQLESLLIKNGINEVTTVKQRWRDSGISVCDRGRVDCKRDHLRCVHIPYPNGLPSMTDFIDYDAEQHDDAIDLASVPDVYDDTDAQPGVRRVVYSPDRDGGEVNE